MPTEVVADDTVRGRIVAAIAQALAPLVPDGAVEIDPSGDPSDFPNLAIFDRGDQVIEREAVLTRRQLDVSIEGYVTGGGGQLAAAKRNDLHASAVAAIFADDTLGGLVELIEDGDLRKMTLNFDSKGRLSFAQDLAVQFTTQRANPALPA